MRQLRRHPPALRYLGAKLGLMLTALALAGPAAAQEVPTETFTTSQSEFTPGVKNQGWWSPRLANNDRNDSYLADGFAMTRNFFTFDLTSACVASSVTLELTRGLQVGDPQTRLATYSLFDVSTPAGTLNANVGTSQTIFEDLGTGASYGSFDIPDGAETDVVSLPLNAAGVTAFNVARGGFFSIGGATPADQFVFVSAGGGPPVGGTQQLVVACALPTTTDECKNGGWRTYGVFKNQGDCVSFVATGGKNPPANGA
jgi:hypothetical protein